VIGKYTGDLCHRPIEVVVDHDMMGQLAADPLLLLGAGQPPGNVVVGVAPGAEARLLDLPRRGHDEDHERSWLAIEHLASALDLDDEQEIATSLGYWSRGVPCSIRRWRAVEVTQIFGPLQKSIASDAGFESGTIDEGVRLVAFTASPRARRPRPAQDQRGIAFQEAGDDRVLPGPTGPRDDDDQSWVSLSNRVAR
jgi:hypothetical protein